MQGVEAASECDVWGPNKTGDLDGALSSGAAGERSSGWRAGGQPAFWDGTAVRGHGVGGGRAEAGGEARGNRIFSS